MRATSFLLSTLRDNPQDAQVVSHRLMLRAGLIRKLGSGLYHLMPVGLRAFRKIENIIRDEMNRAGAVEFQLPILLPSEIWEKSGRWSVMGKEMFRLKDRHDAWNVLGPTHEEAFTDLMTGILKSYKDLPVNVYQIHTKFRDEIRPRFGVMRGREFVMKDAYSFDLDEEGLEKSYQSMRSAYRNIFRRAGVETIPVEADTGSMGGTGSEEFMVPSEIGEETLLISQGGAYRGNQEKTPVIYPELKRKQNKINIKEKLELKRHHTPKLTTIDDVASFLKCTPSDMMKALAYIADGEPVIFFIRGDRDLNEVKAKNHLKAIELNPASGEEILKLNTIPGFIGPVDLSKDIRILYDISLKTRESFIVGANEKDYHLSGYTLRGDEEFAELGRAIAGDPSPAGSDDGVLSEVKGIEVGHIFKLGRKYTQAFKTSVLDENGKPITPIMGCYGIGVNRTMASVIEQHHDDKGIVWPISVAPFEICIVSITKNEDELNRSFEFYHALVQDGFDILWDDRDLRPGVKFADAELIGYPIRLTLGKMFFEKGTVECMLREGLQTLLLEGDLRSQIDQLTKIRENLFLQMREGAGD